MDFLRYQKGRIFSCTIFTHAVWRRFKSHHFEIPRLPKIIHIFRSRGATPFLEVDTKNSMYTAYRYTFYYDLFFIPCYTKFKLESRFLVLCVWIPGASYREARGAGGKDCWYWWLKLWLEISLATSNVFMPFSQDFLVPYFLQLLRKSHTRALVPGFGDVKNGIFESRMELEPMRTQWNRTRTLTNLWSTRIFGFYHSTFLCWFWLTKGTLAG